MILNLKLLSIAAVVILAMGATIAVLTASNSNLRIERDQAVQFSNSKDDSLIRFKNKLGEEVVKTSVLNLSLSNTKKLLEDERLSILKHFNGVNKRLNNLEQVSKTEASYDKVIDVPILPSVDSSGFRTFVYRDSLNSVEGWIKPDSVKIKLHADVPIYSVLYWQRRKNKWLLGLRALAGKEWFDETMSTNPSVTIRQHSTIQIKKRR